MVENVTVGLLNYGLYLLVILVYIRYNESDKQKARQGQGVASTLPPDKEEAHSSMPTAKQQPQRLQYYYTLQHGLWQAVSGRPCIAQCQVWDCLLSCIWHCFVCRQR